MRGFTDDEIVDLATFARQNDYQLRFIEFMPLDADDVWERNMYVPGKEIIAKINAVYPLTQVALNGEAKSDTAQRYRFSDNGNEVGVIPSVSEPFCENCNRVRFTADGKFRTCLFSLTETDLLTPLREGAPDEVITELILDAVANANKIWKHLSEEKIIHEKSIFHIPPHCVAGSNAVPHGIRTKLEFHC